jgi:hypothetical protein
MQVESVNQEPRQLVLFGVLRQSGGRRAKRSSERCAHPSAIAGE